MHASRNAPSGAETIVPTAQQGRLPGASGAPTPWPHAMQDCRPRARAGTASGPLLRVGRYLPNAERLCA